MFQSLVKRTALVGLVLAVMAPLPALAKDQTYGAGVKLPKATPVETLLTSPAKWVGKEVRLDGIVTNVCEKRGCWLELSDAKTGKGMRFKVEDGEIVFPMSARGRKASAEGTFEEVIVSHEEQQEHRTHAKGPVYQIRASGAVIH